MENNIVTVTGRFIEDFEYSHTTYEHDFYESKIEVKRLSGNKDIIVCMIDKNLLLAEKFKKGDYVMIHGQFRSTNKLIDGKSRLLLYVYIKDIDKIAEREFDENYIYVNGYVCKQVIHRYTPFNKEIADLSVAVHRLKSKFSEEYTSDYLPCIAWSKNARLCKDLAVGSTITFTGRIQSRQYTKKISENETKNLTAYEVSINKILTEGENENYRRDNKTIK